MRIAGANVVYAEVDEHYLIEIEDVKRKITNSTRAVIIVDLYGKVGSYKRFKDELRDDIVIIEDACQAFGVDGVGKYSGISVFSFNPLKNFGLITKGGGVTTPHKNVADKIKKLRNHGFDPKNKTVKLLYFGANSRLDPLTAIAGVVRLKFYYFNYFKRMYLTSLYVDGLKPLKTSNQIEFPELLGDNCFYLFPALFSSVEERERIQKKISDKYRIEAKQYYPVLSHHQPGNSRHTVLLPKTESLHKRTLHLPLSNNISMNEIEYVVNSIMSEM